jgi:hypothetical protein
MPEFLQNQLNEDRVDLDVFAARVSIDLQHATIRSIDKVYHSHSLPHKQSQHLSRVDARSFRQS